MKSNHALIISLKHNETQKEENGKRKYLLLPIMFVRQFRFASILLSFIHFQFIDIEQTISVHL